MVVLRAKWAFSSELSRRNRNLGSQRCCNTQNNNSQHLHTRIIRRIAGARLGFVLASRMYRFEDGKPLTALSRLTHTYLTSLTYSSS